MEEDIKILEDLIQYYERLSKNEVFTEQDRNNVIRRIQALENLLKRNYYLENEARKIINQELNKAQIDLYKNYIPISVIQNKINKLEPQVHLLRPNAKPCEMMREFKVEGALNVLQELLEERNK